MQNRMPRLLITAACLTFLVGCAANPADDVPAAEIGEAATVDEAGAMDGAAVDAPAEAAADPADAGDAIVSNEVDEADPNAPMTDPAAAALPAGEYPLYGSIQAVASKVSRSHTLVFPTWTGSWVTDGTLEGSLLGFELDVDALLLDPGNDYAMKDRLETHLRSEDFFLVADYPTASFSSSAITPGGAGGTHTISGDLTLRGVTQPISFPATIVVVDGVATATADFSVNRQDWQLAYPGAPDDLIRDEVVLSIKLSTDPAAAGAPAEAGSEG
ncbi:MAG: YceI family protein [Chloroflexi bacterium]|nr:YceI family protein [Chloroflexota bacterium]